MSITSPAEEHNGAEQWMTYWRRRREAQLREMVTPEILEEFRADPHGARGRSKALAQILNYMRMQPIEDRVFAYAEVPFERYRLGSMHAELAAMNRTLIIALFSIVATLVGAVAAAVVTHMF